MLPASSLACDALFSNFVDRPTICLRLVCLSVRLPVRLYICLIVFCLLVFLILLPEMANKDEYKTNIIYKSLFTK